CALPIFPRLHDRVAPQSTLGVVRVREVRAENHGRLATAGERRQVWIGVPHDREVEGLRLHGLRESLNGKQDYHDGRPLRNEESHLEPVVFLTALLILVGIPAVTVLKLARLRAAGPHSSSADVTARLEEVERGVQDLRHELAETQERLDFTERVLSKAREGRRTR